MPHGSWYEFLDRPQDQRGQRAPFQSTKQGLLWIAVRLSFVGLWGLLVAAVFVVQDNKVVALGLIGVLLPSVGPLILAALIAAAHAFRDLGNANHATGEHPHSQGAA